MTDALIQKTIDEMRSDMVRAIEEGDRVLVEKLNALGEYDVSAFPGGQFVQFAERAAYLRGLEDAAAFCESHAAAIPYGEHRHTAPTYAGYVMDEIDHEAEFNHQGNGYAAAIRALAKEKRK